MGADIYLGWKGMTEKEHKKQITGFDVTCGRFGYLRGSYGGHIGFYAIQQLFEGISWEKKWKVKIVVLRANLQKLEKGLFKKKKKEFYHEKGKNLEIQSYRDFVALAEKLVKQGKEPRVRFSY